MPVSIYIREPAAARPRRRRRKPKRQPEPVPVPEPEPEPLEPEQPEPEPGPGPGPELELQRSKSDDDGRTLAGEPAWPAVADEVTDAWLNTVVPGASNAGGVVSFTVAPVGQGVVADAFRVSLTYNSDGAAACRAVVLKLSKEDARVRATNLPLYRREILFYEKFASLLPVQVANVHAAFIDEESGAHCIVMDDCMNMEGGEVFAFPYWMMGAEEGFITKMVCDLAVLHGSFVNHRCLDDPELRVRAGVPEWMSGLTFTPSLAPLMAEFWSTVDPDDAAFIGCDADAPKHTAWVALLEAKKDVLKLSFEVDGRSYWCGDQTAPVRRPFPIASGDRGKRVSLAILEKMGARKIQTLLHGDGHPGNVFHQQETDRFTWIDFQLTHVGPPGFELSQGLPMGLNGADRAMFERVVAAYYAAFIAAAPAGTAEQYTAEECWEDFLFGIYLWGLALTPLSLQLLRKACSLPDDDPGLAGLRAILPRSYLCNHVLGMEQFIVDFAQAEGLA